LFRGFAWHGGPFDDFARIRLDTGYVNKSGAGRSKLDARPLVEETTTQVRIYIFITRKQEPFYASHLWEGPMYIR